MNGRHVIAAMALLALASLAAAEPATLTGQVVCSQCWFEADRDKVPYGGAEDLVCWKTCAKQGVPSALAVTGAGSTRLVTLEYGRLKKTPDGWYPYVGKRVEVRGDARGAEKPAIAVDEIRVLGPAAAPGAPAGAAPEAPAEAPEYERADLSGTMQRLSSYRGKLVVLNFWATWCVPCRKEMPDLIKTQNAFAAWGVQVIGVSADEPGARVAVETFVGKHGLNFPVWLGASTEDMVSFGLNPALPATVIIDRDGRIAVRIDGETTEKELKKHLDVLLKATPPAAAPARSRTQGPVPTVCAAASPSRKSSVPS